MSNSRAKGLKAVAVHGLC